MLPGLASPALPKPPLWHRNGAEFWCREASALCRELSAEETGVWTMHRFSLGVLVLTLHFHGLVTVLGCIKAGHKPRFLFDSVRMA